MAVPLEVFQKRVGVLTAQKKELEERLAKLSVDPHEVSPPANLKDLDVLVNQRALELSRISNINNVSNAIAAAGHNVAPDFLQKVGMMSQILGVGPESYVEVINEAADSDPKVAAQLLYDLAKDPTKAGTVFAMSPLKQVVALAKMAKKDAPTPRKDPPPPIVPKGSGRSQIPEVPVNTSDPKTDIDAWMTARDTEARARRRR
jgi:hypothetical protein